MTTHNTSRHLNNNIRSGNWRAKFMIIRVMIMNISIPYKIKQIGAVNHKEYMVVIK